MQEVALQKMMHPNEAEERLQLYKTNFLKLVSTFNFFH